MTSKPTKLMGLWGLCLLTLIRLAPLVNIWKLLLDLCKPLALTPKLLSQGLGTCPSSPPLPSQPLPEIREACACGCYLVVRPPATLSLPTTYHRRTASKGHSSLWLLSVFVLQKPSLPIQNWSPQGKRFGAVSFFCCILSHQEA